MYFCTFTCYKWISLFEKTNSYDLIYNWFNVIKQKYNAEVIAYVIMPNHVHCILYFKDAGFNLNSIISNGKRFMAYEIIKRLQQTNQTEILNVLSAAVSDREKKKGQLHKVFEESFDAKAIFSEPFLHQKINYIHSNPVSGKWNLAEDFTKYVHSTASFYELGKPAYFEPKHYKDI
ncbi:MAG: transposase [Chitinophagaceae bacterium]|nr:transposase [Chitinophagaceae bacterium]